MISNILNGQKIIKIKIKFKVSCTTFLTSTTEQRKTTRQRWNSSLILHVGDPKHVSNQNETWNNQKCEKSRIKRYTSGHSRKWAINPFGEVSANHESAYYLLITSLRLCCMEVMCSGTKTSFWYVFCFKTAMMKIGYSDHHRASNLLSSWDPKSRETKWAN